MTDTDLERRLEAMFAAYPGASPDPAAAWRQFTRLRAQAGRGRGRRMRLTFAAVTVAVAVSVAVSVAVPVVRQAVLEHGKPVAAGAAGRLVVTARIPLPGAVRALGDEGSAIAVAGTAKGVWALTYSQWLIRIDPSTNKVTLRERIPGAADLAVGAAAVWVTIRPGRHGQLLRLWPASGQVRARFPLPKDCDQVVASGHRLWVACGRGAVRLLGLDPATGQVLAQTGAAPGVTSIAASPRGIWMAGRSGITGFVESGARLRRIKVSDPGYPVSFAYTESLVFGQGRLWALTNDESVAEINPATGRVVRVYGYQSYDPGYSMGLDFLAVGGHSLWFLADGQRRAGVVRVSVGTGSPQARADSVGSCGEPCWQIYYAAGSAWVPARTALIRVGPAPRRQASE
jgi:hypothetical protein